MRGAKPDCYKCAHRRDLPGSCHSRCGHPKVLAAIQNDPLGEVIAMLGKRFGPMEPPVTPVHVTGNPHGISNGWFHWPFNFDPIWLVSCDGFAEAGTVGP
jgi:hypothetical protein